MVENKADLVQPRGEVPPYTGRRTKEENSRLSFRYSRFSKHRSFAGGNSASAQERASSSNEGSGIPGFQVGSRNSSRLPVGSKK